MRELIIIHPAIVGIAGGIILAAMLFVPVWLHERKRRTAIQKKEASEVWRRVLNVENGGHFEIGLSCGHTVELRIGLPRELMCPDCAREIEQLKKMAGER